MLLITFDERVADQDDPIAIDQLELGGEPGMRPGQSR